MPAYRIYLLDPSGRIARYRIHECATDDEALQQASRIRDARHPAAEVWLRDRMVGKTEIAAPEQDSPLRQGQA